MTFSNHRNFVRRGHDNFRSSMWTNNSMTMDNFHYNTLNEMMEKRKGKTDHNQKQRFAKVQVAHPPDISNQTTHSCAKEIELHDSSTNVSENVTKLSRRAMELSHPDIWGPRFWLVFHLAASFFPVRPSKSIREAFENFIVSIPLFLPCPLCRHHAMKYITEHRQTVSKAVETRQGVFDFFVDFHNDVNIRKEKETMSRKQAYELWGFDESDFDDINIVPTQRKIEFSNPDIWGPHFWFFIHTASVHYPTKPSIAIQQAFQNFIFIIPLLLPCRECSKHSIQFIRKNSINIRCIVRSRDEIFSFFVDFHNDVNKRHSKPILPLDIVKTMYGFD